MTLKKDVYRTLEDIVGSENISDDPVILDSYTFNWLAEIHPEFSPSKYGIRPEAVLLPAATEEVQAIVKACNTHRVKYKAHSTGYGIYAFPGQEGVIVIDLRKMNRILQIDEHNKFAVVEPYVTWAQLIAEILPKGLFTTTIQAGSQASVLANVTAMWGVNVWGNHGGHNGRNMLGVEWVMPTGEIIKLGPKDDWFSNDGPGPALRGIFRGHLGSLGGLGIFTKCAIKLHNWPGPPSLPTVGGGAFSNYMVKEPPWNIKAYMIAFKTYDDLIDFLYKVGDAQIAYSIIRVGEAEHLIPMLASSVSNKDLYEWHEVGMIKALALEAPHPCIVVLAANSQGEFEYQKKILDEIIAETNGTIPTVAQEGGMLEEVLNREFIPILVGGDTHFAHHSGGFIINAAYTGTCESVFRHQGPGGEELKKKYIEQGTILDDGLDSLYHNSFDNNSYVYAEVELHYDASDHANIKGAMGLLEDEAKLARERKYALESSDIMVAIGGGKTSAEKRIQSLGSLCRDFHIWQERIKQAFDPNDLSDRSNYGAGYSAKESLKKKGGTS